MEVNDIKRGKNSLFKIRKLLKNRGVRKLKGWQPSNLKGGVRLRNVESTMLLHTMSKDCEFQNCNFVLSYFPVTYKINMICGTLHQFGLSPQQILG